MRYDYLGVREFAEKMFRDGGLDTGEGAPSLSKARKGIRLHKAVQKHYESIYPDFVSEKQIVYTHSQIIDQNEVSFTLDGRIDGLYREKDSDGDITVIVEIKSCDTHPAEAEKVHLIQGALYAYILSRCTDETIRFRVDVVYGLYSDYSDLKIFSNIYTKLDLEQLLTPCCARYARFVSYMIDHAEKVKNELSDLPFLFKEFRHGQRTMAVNVYNAIKDPDIPMLLLQAPTGIGKTAGTIYPTLKAMEFQKGYKSVVFYLTARNEGSRPAEDALSRFCANTRYLKYCSLISKEKLCIYQPEDIDGMNKPGSKCDKKNCPYAIAHYDNVDLAINDALDNEIRKIDRVCVQELSEKYKVCPFELMLDLSIFCDVIIGDYNYVFDPEASLKRYINSDKCNYYFLVDEAHQLPDRVRSMYSASLSHEAFERTAKGKKRNKIGKLLKKAGEITAEASETGEDFLSLLDKICDEGFDYLDNKEDDKLLELIFDIFHFKTIEEISHQGGFITFHSEEAGGTLNLICMDPSEIIRDKCSISAGSVLFSGTLLPKDYFACELGARDMPYCLFRSPFPSENLLVLAGTFADTRYKVREASYGGLASFITLLGKTLKKGNYIVYFSSYSYMESVLDFMDDNFKKKSIFIQPKGSKPEKRKVFISGFKENPADLHIGMCVLGGGFSEGVDLPGSKLSGVVIIGTGMPQVGTYTQLLKDYYDNISVENGYEEGYGFKNAYFYPGVNKIIQAAGRVIRTETDRGFVLLLDNRYSRFDYRSALEGCLDYKIIDDPEKIIHTVVDFMGEIC